MSAKTDLQRLLQITKGCREDMHEPDEQDVYAEFGPNTVKMDKDTVMRTGFDNACSGEMSYDMGFWIIKRVYYSDSSYDEKREWFNLANIVALARKATQ